MKDLSDRLKEWGVEKYRLQQVLQWLYERDIGDFSEMTNLSKKLRESLSEHFSIERMPVETMQRSSDGTL